MKITEGRGTAETPCRKRGTEAKEVYSEGEKQVNADAYLFFGVGTRSESEVITILPTVRSIAAFFHFLNFTSFF